MLLLTNKIKEMHGIAQGTSSRGWKGMTACLKVIVFISTIPRLVEPNGISWFEAKTKPIMAAILYIPNFFQTQMDCMKQLATMD
jgi:hypothetical protein